VLARIGFANGASHEEDHRLAVELFGLGLADADTGLLATRAKLFVGREIEDGVTSFEMLGQRAPAMFVLGFAGFFRLGRAFRAFGFAAEAVFLGGRELRLERSDFGLQVVDPLLKMSRLLEHVRLQIAHHRLQRGNIIRQWCVGFHAELWTTIRGCTRGKLQLGSGIATMPFGGGNVDAIENHGELRGGEFDLRITGRGKMVSTAFESLTPQAQSVGAPVENFESIGGSIGEDEQVTAERIGVQGRLHMAEEAIESESEIDGFAVTKSCRGRETQHERASTEAMSVASCSGA